MHYDAQTLMLKPKPAGSQDKAHSPPGTGWLAHHVMQRGRLLVLDAPKLNSHKQELRELGALLLKTYVAKAKPRASLTSKADRPSSRADGSKPSGGPSVRHCRLLNPRPA